MADAEGVHPPLGLDASAVRPMPDEPAAPGLGRLSPLPVCVSEDLEVEGIAAAPVRYGHFVGCDVPRSVNLSRPVQENHEVVAPGLGPIDRPRVAAVM